MLELGDLLAVGPRFGVRGRAAVRSWRLLVGLALSGGSFAHSEFVLVFDLSDPLVVIVLCLLEFFLEELHLLGFRRLSRLGLVHRLDPFLLLAHRPQLLLKLLFLVLKLFVQPADFRLKLPLALGPLLSDSVRLRGLDQHADAVGILVLHGLLQQAAFLLELSQALLVLAGLGQLFFEVMDLPEVCFALIVAFAKQPLVLPEEGEPVLQLSDLLSVGGSRLRAFLPQLVELFVLVADDELRVIELFADVCLLVAQLLDLASQLICGYLLVALCVAVFLLQPFELLVQLRQLFLADGGGRAHDILDLHADLVVLVLDEDAALLLQQLELLLLELPLISLVLCRQVFVRALQVPLLAHSLGIFFLVALQYEVKLLKLSLELDLLVWRELLLEGASIRVVRGEGGNRSASTLLGIV